MKAENAQAAGAAAVIIFNEGQPGRDELFVGTLGAPVRPSRSSGSSFADAQALAQPARGRPGDVHVETSTRGPTTARPRTCSPTSKQGDADQTVVVGAHLDSVAAGPGHQRQRLRLGDDPRDRRDRWPKQKVKPRRPASRSRSGAPRSSACWAPSTTWTTLSARGRLAKIYANLNFDMVGSPNYVRFVYDGDGSDDRRRRARPARRRSRPCSTTTSRSQGLATDPTAFDGRSDYGPFIAVGIPAGGLFTGAEGIKTAEQAAVYGGTAGVAVRPVLPPGLRHDRQPLDQGAERDVRRRRSRHAHVRAVEVRPLRGRQPRAARNKRACGKFDARRARAPLADLPRAHGVVSPKRAQRRLRAIWSCICAN